MIDANILKLVEEFQNLALIFSKSSIPNRRDPITLEELNWSRFPGVYIIYFEGSDYIYIGSSMTTMGSTIWANGKVDRQTCLWNGDVIKGQKAVFVEYLKLDSDFRFYAPALESFLIDRMRSLGFNLLNKRS